VRVLARDFPRITDYLCADAGAFCRRRKYLDIYGVAYRVDPLLSAASIITRKRAFEVIDPAGGQHNAVLAADATNDMMKDSAADICGIGFACGVERLIAGRASSPPPQVRLCRSRRRGSQNESVELARFFRAGASRRSSNSPTGI
jgi:histidyl-tRNA synthetase